MNAGRHAPRRIVVAFDASAGSRAALITAAAAAEVLGADIEALFVEDADLLHLAGLPFARALGPGGFHPLDVQAMERVLHEHALAAERACNEIGHGLNVNWRFRVERGRIGSVLLAATDRGDLIALGTTGGRSALAGLGSTARALLAVRDRSLLIASPQTALTGPIGCVFDGGPSAGETLSRAKTLARAAQRPLVLYLTGNTPAEYARQRETASRYITDPRLPVRYRSAPFTDPRALADLILADSPSSVVLSQPLGMPASEFRALLGRLDGIAWVTAAAPAENVVS